jgi:serine/threonine protein kinase
MGEVYRARDLRLKRDVAIKVSAAQFTERFDREAQAIARAESSQHLYAARYRPELPR